MRIIHTIGFFIAGVFLINLWELKFRVENLRAINNGLDFPSPFEFRFIIYLICGIGFLFFSGFLFAKRKDWTISPSKPEKSEAQEDSEKEERETWERERQEQRYYEDQYYNESMEQMPSGPEPPEPEPTKSEDSK